MRLYGVVGWKNAGKTGLMERLVTEITGRGFSVSTVKHAHHRFDVDHPGKDSYRHRVAGATEVLLANSTVREKIREGEEDDLPSIINSSEGEGMHSFTSSFYRMVKDDWVDLVTAKHHAPNREALDSMVKGVSVKAQTLVSRVKSPR